jgi:hypothetical protein
VARVSDVNPWALATGSDVAAFEAAYSPEMARYEERRGGGGSSALLGGVGNNDPVARLVIANRLLDDGADASFVGSESVNALHVLFTRHAHGDLEAEAALVRRLLDGGADVNLRSPRYGPVLETFVRMRVPPPEVSRVPFYDVVFDREDLRFEVRVQGSGPGTLAGWFSRLQKMTILQERFRSYIERYPESLGDAAGDVVPLRES